MTNRVRVSAEEKKARKSARSKQYRIENRERISAQRHEYYLQHSDKIKARVKKYYENMTDEQREQRKQKRAEYLERNPELKQQRSEQHRNYYQQNREYYTARQRKYYSEHREEIRVYVNEYIIKNADKIREQRAQYKLLRKHALKMCPAFKFAEYIRLKHNDVFLTKYKRYTKLANTASKQCQAIQCGDYKKCSLCTKSNMTDQEMAQCCPMPRVFEFDDAFERIRFYASGILLAKPRQK
jgi:hypothetical protein